MDFIIEGSDVYSSDSTENATLSVRTSSYDNPCGTHYGCQPNNNSYCNCNCNCDQN
ncbi:MAG: hypothetical protein K6E47_10000 [Lachnospiraceae bacterium]|nr:hypothetical protein [Lachnospiraceae bacterium]